MKPARSHSSLPTAIPVLAGLLALASFASAQEANRPSLTGDAALEARRQSLENRPYTIKSGDFRLLITPSLGLDYNDNINTSHDDALDDFILRPFLQFDASYPITRANLLRVNIGVGYDYYFNHDDYSGFRLRSGSLISFDVYAGDFWFNLHDQLQFTEDAAGQAAAANAGRYGGFDNTAGLTVTWDLQDVVLALGYDHYNFIASSSEWEYTDRSSEMPNLRAGFRVNPALITGLEANASFTTYDQRVLNDNTGYGVGAYADWQAGKFFKAQLRGGYSVFLFDQTSLVLKAVDQDSWYVGLNLTHSISEALSYSLRAGHEIRLGIESDSIEDWYVRPSLNWKFIKDFNLTTYLSYENGKQGNNPRYGFASENYDWLGLGFVLSHPITKKLIASLSYRLTLRYSDIISREYTQNLVGIQLKYLFQ